MTVDELLERHRVHQERRGNLPGSIEKREIAVRAFARWLDPRGLLEATQEDIETFMDARRARDGRKISARTRHVWTSNFRAFYGWALLEELIEKDPSVGVVRPKMRRTLPRPIEDDDLKRALDEAPPQMRAILSLAAYAGLRCQEIAGVDREDVLEAKGLLRVVKGKGGHERIVPLHPEALAALRCLPMPRTGALFSRPRGGRYDGELMSVAIRDYFRTIGVDATAHQLRHWFATSVYAGSHDIRLTQELLGHASPSTTAIYVAFSSVDAAAAVGALSIG